MDLWHGFGDGADGRRSGRVHLSCSVRDECVSRRDDDDDDDNDRDNYNNNAATNAATIYVQRYRDVPIELFGGVSVPTASTGTCMQRRPRVHGRG